MKEYKVGFIGFGFIGKVHACGYINLPLFYNPVPLRVRPAAVCASRPESAEQGRALLNADSATTDFRAITENPDIDIVHICTPNHLHRDALVSAMRNQKHIYCDKPLVASADEAGEIAALLPQYNATGQMTLQNRFFPAVMRARELLREGALGQILQFRACYLHSGSADPGAPLKWKLSAAAGGGVVADLGAHVLDLVHFLLGDYARVCALTKTAYPERPAENDPGRKVPVDAEDCFMTLAEMACGACGVIEATKLATGAEDEVRFELHGSKGALRFNGMDAHHIEFYDASAPGAPLGGTRGWTRIDSGQRYPAPASGFPGPKFAVGWLRSHVACLANFLAAIAAGSPGDPGLGHGVFLQRLMHTVKQSAAAGTWRAVPKP